LIILDVIVNGMVATNGIVVDDEVVSGFEFDGDKVEGVVVEGASGVPRVTVGVAVVNVGDGDRGGVVDDV
jgi:hypothetical protein